jgi:hypothetical protein
MHLQDPSKAICVDDFFECAVDEPTTTHEFKDGGNVTVGLAKR